MQKVCPCSKPIANENFIFFIIILDIILGIGTLFGIILPLIGLIIYFQDKNFQSGYFRCYAISRFIIGIIALFIIVGFSIYLMAVGIENNAFFKGVANPKIIIGIFLALYIPFIIWHLYLSLNFMDTTKKEDIIQEHLTDEEKNENTNSEQSKKNLAENKSVSQSIKNDEKEEEKI